MNRFLNTNNYADCCGCSACTEICPTSCIVMSKTEEGFLYPQFLDTTKCLNCSLCSKVCPMEEEPSKVVEITALAGYTINNETIMKSSSGGIFPELANFFLDSNGVVYGAHLQDDHKLVHIGIDNPKDLYKILGSKYIQSDINNCYSLCKKDLENGKKVLFSGTPCQINGLYKFLKCDYENLYTADVICHGVPSQKMFDLYVDFLERKHNAKLIDINFRDKTKNGWSITLKYTMEFKNGKRKNYYLISPLSEYFSGFLGGLFMRESCYCCPFASLDRSGDITMGDFWGYQKTRPDLMHFEGLSLILVNSEKGQNLIKILKDKSVFFDSVSKESIEASENKNLYKPTARPEQRNSIYSELDQNGFNFISAKYLRKHFTIKNRIKNIIPKKIINRLKGNQK